MFLFHYRFRFSGPLKAVPIRNTFSLLLFYDTASINLLIDFYMEIL